MATPNAFVTPDYPLLLSVIPGGEGEIPPGSVGLVLALLVQGIPSFLCTVVLEEEGVEERIASLRSGPVRVAVMGLLLPLEEEEGTVLPTAFVSLLCADGQRLGLTRIVGRDRGASAEGLARLVIRQIARGVQIPDLVTAP